MGGTLELFLRLVISMAVVMGVMGGAARLLRPAPAGGRGPDGGCQRAKEAALSP